MKQHISIWFFTGVLLLVYGVIIGAAGVYGLSHPPENHVVLEGLHIDIWWGAALAIAGAVYCWKFAPTGKE